MDLELKCELGRGNDNVRFTPRSLEKGIIVDVTRDYEAENILLGDKDVERLYEYIGEYLGKNEEIVPKDNGKSIEEVSELLDMSFRCTSDPVDTLDTCWEDCDGELYLCVRNDDEVASVYLSSDDALNMAENIIKAFGSVGQSADPNYMRPFKEAPEANEHEAASKEDLDKVAAELKELREDFHSSMEDVVKDWFELTSGLQQSNVEIAQLQNDTFNNNESLKVKLESLDKQTEDVSKEFTAALEHLATRIDDNSDEILSLNIVRKINEAPNDIKI